MAYCSRCGAEIDNEAVICVHCGCSVNGNVNGLRKNEVDYNAKAGAIEIIGSVFIPIVGIVLYFCYREQKPNAAKSCLTAAIIVLLVEFLGGLFLGMAGISFMSGLL